MRSTVLANTLYNIQDTSGNSLVTFSGVRSCTSIIFSSESLKKGSSYSIYTGGSSTRTLNRGIYTGGESSGGTLKNTFTISSSVTNFSF
ncbi:MAG: hypothetical protein PHH37_02550 [Paludibacter sp.]|nr:hypothetical protein [Paludibacter sp.]